MNPSPRPKSLALMFLLGSFLAGSAISYAAVRTFSDPQGRAYTETNMRDELEQKLHLSPAQRASLDSAYDARKAQFDSILAPHKAPMDSIRVATRQRVMLVLDSTQKATYMQMIEEQRRTDARRGGVTR